MKGTGYNGRTPGWEYDEPGDQSTGSLPASESQLNSLAVLTSHKGLTIPDHIMGLQG